MANELGIYNALGWGYVQMRGGWKNLSITIGGYAALIFTLVMVSVWMRPDYSQSMLQGWTAALLMVQAGLLLLLGMGTVGSAVKLDHTSRMIESHRLMPTSAFSAIAGYLMGAPCQAIGLGLATFIIGAITAAGAKIEFA